MNSLTKNIFNFFSAQKVTLQDVEHGELSRYDSVTVLSIYDNYQFPNI